MQSARQKSWSNGSAASLWLDERWRVAAVCVFLAVLNFAVFGQTLRHEFVYFDDNEYVFDNPHVTQGLTAASMAWAFTHIHAANWHPLTWLSHMADCQLFGLNPAGHHLMSVLIHTTSVVLLFLLLRRMTGAFWKSAFVAAVFGIHPLRAESVAWVAERKDVLSGLLFILTVDAYARYARREWSLLRYGWVVLAFALGLMAKPMLVTAPAVLLLLDYWPLRRGKTRGRLLVEKIPLLLLASGSCIVTLVAQRHAIQASDSFPASTRFGNALISTVVYLGQMMVPKNLAVFYPYPTHLSVSGLLLAGFVIAGLTVVVIWQRRVRPWLLVGWFWYLVMLLPVIGLVQVSIQAHADRYTYLPQIGLYVALSWLVDEWCKSRAAAGALMSLTLCALAICAFKQTACWKDSERLWEHTIACTQRNYLAHYNLGVYFTQTGRLDEAIGEYEAALRYNPGDANTHYNCGIALTQKGRLEDAMSQYQRAVQIDPNHAEAWNNIGSLFLDRGQIDKAIDPFQRALQIKPAYAEAHYNLALALDRKNRVREALLHFQSATGLKPDNPLFLSDYARLLATCSDSSLRDGRKAIQVASRADDLTGGADPAIMGTLAAALAEGGRFPDAVETAQHALDLAAAKPNLKLAAQLRAELKLYRAGRSLREGPAH